MGQCQGKLPWSVLECSAPGNLHKYNAESMHSWYSSQGQTWRHITWFTCAFISPMSCRSVQLYYESWNCFSNSKRIFVVGTLKSDFNLFVFVYFAKCQNGNAYFLFVCFFFNSRYKSLFKWNHCRVPNSGVATGWQRCPRLGDRDKKKKKKDEDEVKKKKKKKKKKRKRRKEKREQNFVNTRTGPH